MKKILIFCIVLMMILPLVFACREESGTPKESGSEKNDSGTNTEDVQTEDPYIDGVPDNLTFDGRDFVMTGPIPSGYYVFYQEEQSDEPVKGAIYKRNRILEDRFDITIKGMELGYTDSHAQEFAAYAQSEEDFIDVMGIGFYQSGLSLIMNDFVLPWNDVDYINLDKSWWNKSATETLSIVGNYYYLTGSINVGALKCTMPVFFNKNVAEELKSEIGNLYQTVLDGDWTYDLFVQYIKSYSHDNGDSVQDENDYYGLVQNGHTLMSHLYYADVVTAYVRDDGVELAITTDKIVNIVDKARALLNDQYQTYMKDGSVEIADIFFADRALFMQTDLSAAEHWRNENSDFGILPLPKYDESQENYTTYADQWGLMLALPCTASDTSRTGAILEAMAALSAKYVTPAYYDILLLNKLKRDEESEKMLDILYSNVIYDPGTIYAGDLNLLPVNACIKKNVGLTTWYAAFSEQLYLQISSVYEHINSTKK